MFRFTIRDVLWLMVVVGMGVGWLLNASALRAAKVAAQKESARISNLLITENQAHLELSGKYIRLKDEVDRTYQINKSLNEQLEWERAKEGRTTLRATK